MSSMRWRSAWSRAVAAMALWICAHLRPRLAPRRLEAELRAQRQHRAHHLIQQFGIDLAWRRSRLAAWAPGTAVLARHQPGDVALQDLRQHGQSGALGLRAAGQIVVERGERNAAHLSDARGAAGLPDRLPQPLRESSVASMSCPLLTERRSRPPERSTRRVAAGRIP